MSCQVEQIADCGDISCLARALFIPEREDTNWLSQCPVSLSSCGSLLAVGYKNRLCLLTVQWINSTDTNAYLVSWSGTLPADITAVLALPICPSQQSSQSGPDWVCVIVGFKNGGVGFYTNTGHLLLQEKLDERPVMKISCHTGTYGTLPDDVHILYQTCECIVTGTNLFQTLRNAKAQLARVQAGLQDDYTVDSRNINIKKWMFTEQETINDASVVGLELKNTYDHLLAASTYGGYDTWYRSVPTINTLILGVGVKPYVGFHYALEGGTNPPLQDVARAVANKIKSALPGWLGGGSPEGTGSASEPVMRAEALSMRMALCDAPRLGTAVAVSQDRRLAAFTDSLGRVAVLDVKRGHLIRLFKGYRDAQCAFVQIFEQEKKPKLSVVKEIRRAVFLIIYNPKKGLIDIRLMQKGNRVAVFTATKNGTLIYNTCGLVGAEKSYTHKKINLPELQCVLIDPDGKLKKFNIPFFFALDGEDSERSKDLHILRELRTYIKKTTDDVTSEEYKDKIIKKASGLKTLELKKHCLEILIRNHTSSPAIITSCLELFWDSIADMDLNEQEQQIKQYFINLFLLTLFYTRINDEQFDNLRELDSKMLEDLKLDDNSKVKIISNDEESNPLFQLLENDNCILERLLSLAHENDYKEQQQPKVTFADNNVSTYKEFISCFLLEEKSRYLSLKTDIPMDKLSNLASDIFQIIFKMNNPSMLSKFVKQSNIDPKEIVKLIIMHLTSMPLEEINIELIEKFITILYYICRVTEEATNIIYNEISVWWENIRSMLVEMPCPLRSMIVAMACKSVAKMLEDITSENDEDAWESLTKENTEWGILIGKLEDISILSIVLTSKDQFIAEEKELPKLQVTDFNINLKYIYTRGKGSVTELIAKWLCSMGVAPEAIIANELIEIRSDPNFESSDSEEDGSATYIFMENNRVYVDENKTIFKWFALLHQQFPLSTKADYILANMCWEYAMAWQKDMQKTEELKAVIHCLKFVSDLHIRLGMFSIIWSTYIKHKFQATCRLINKVGKLPKEPLCLQDIGFSDIKMVNFLEITTKYLEDFLNYLTMPFEQEKQVILYENLWDVSTPSLVEVAQDITGINRDILSLNFQMSCTIYAQCHFNISFSKPLDNLYDTDYLYALEALAGNQDNRKISMAVSDKTRNARMKFLTKVIRSAIDTITSVESWPSKSYNTRDYTCWMDKIEELSKLWNIEIEFMKHQQIVGLYYMGYDSLAIRMIDYIEDPEMLMTPVLAITTQRLKRSYEHSNNPLQWIAVVLPHIYHHVKNTELDTSIPAHPSLDKTASVLETLLHQISEKTGDSPSNKHDVKLANHMIETCRVLLRYKLHTDII